MDAVPLLLGALLGLGALLVWRGFRILSDRTRSDPDRRKGFWWLNGGLALIALSALAFTYASR